MIERIVICICILMGIVASISSYTFYNYSELKSIERNIESAIAKGIDPVGVRCAYTTKASDTICITYAMSPNINAQSANVAPSLIKK